MNRVFIKTYGCQMNVRDSEAVAAMLRGRGYRIVDEEAIADIVLLNTCSVRDLAEQKAISKSAHLAGRKKKNPRFILGIMGCMAQNRGAELIDRLPDLDLVVGTQRFHHVPDYLDQLRLNRDPETPRPSPIIDLEEEADSQNTIKDHHLESGRQVTAFVSIMQGCNMSCAFCIVPKTRGPERSRPIEEIAREVEELTANGTREVTLLGQIVTSYGRGVIPVVDGKSAFVQLLERLHEIDGLIRIRFTSPHPRGFNADLVQAYRDLPKLCEYVHLPIQSGSNRILKAMNRPYSREKYLQIVDSLRTAVPDMYFSTDVIVGFPGETDDDFALTQDMFAQVGYDMAYIFKYSIRSGTPAETMPDQIADEVKEARNQTLLQMLNHSSRERNKSLLGTRQDVLIEGPSRRGSLFTGRNRGNRVVLFEANERLVGELVQIQIDRVTASSLYGSIVLEGVENQPALAQTNAR
jgi:tRNA-2-methylthio-N6-dimethylallyladenosine synthase